MLPKPDDIVDRDEDWEILSRFARENVSGEPGAGIAAITGRRRTGKSYLLDRFWKATGGIYFEASQEEGLVAAQVRFRSTVAEALLRPRPRFFTETEIEHLLREDPRAGDKAIYRRALKAVADAATTMAKVGGVIGESKDETDPVVSRLVSMGYVEERVDFLRPRNEFSG